VHPALLQPFGICPQEADRHRDGHNHPRRSDDAIQPLFHNAVLVFENAGSGLGLRFRLDMLDKQAHEVKQAREPNDNTDDVKRFEPVVGHGDLIK
jgi:hypothetical protein